MANEYDFIIVGGGTSGLVVATRLTEDSNTKVLVVEAGKNHKDDPRVKIPAFYEALKGSEADWAFKSEKQAALWDRAFELRQGRALGGSSAINAHVFVPPSTQAIDTWEKLGNPGWNWATLKDYFAKSYSVQPTDQVAKSWLGHDWDSIASGPLKASFPGKEEDPIRKAWSDTFETLGYHTKVDPFQGSALGAFSCLASIDSDTKERSYAGTAYYDPARERENLVVKTEAMVEKVNFESSDQLRATSISYRYNGEVHTANASKEVIIAAGALQTPKLLELSGIGSHKVLDPLGIDVILENNNVGENLQDHLLCGIAFEAQDHLETLDGLVRQEQEAIGQAMKDYTELKTGVLTSVGVASFAYLPIIEFITPQGVKDLNSLLEKYDESISTKSKAQQTYYDIVKSSLQDQTDVSGAYLTVATQTILPTEPKTAQTPLGPSEGKFVTIATVLCQPLSRGSVHITSKEIDTPPSIDPRYFYEALDVDVMARHMMYIDTIVRTEPFSSLLKKPLRRRDPDALFENAEDAKAYLRSSAVSNWHYTSTCAMLPHDDGGVVNHDLVVYGTSNLRIIDASIMPLIPRANLQSTVYAVAERAADLIKARYGMSL